jgi:hypothetical protein
VKFPTARDATTYRRKMCHDIAQKLFYLGYDCDWYKVNRNYIVFRRWWDGQLALGYLIRQTGLRKREGV